MAKCQQIGLILKVGWGNMSKRLCIILFSFHFDKI